MDFRRVLGFSLWGESLSWSFRKLQIDDSNGHYSVKRDKWVRPKRQCETCKGGVRRHYFLNQFKEILGL